MTEQPEAPTFAWSAHAVDVPAIEAALARLRQEAAGEPTGEGLPFAVRTSVLNLVAYAADRRAAAQAAQTIGRLSEMHPSRSLVLLVQPARSRGGIDVQLSAHCHLAPDLRQQVCCEELMLTVKGPPADHLHSVIIPLLVPDLPVFAWCSGELPQDPHLLESMGEADRLIVDSALWSRPLDALPRLRELLWAGWALADLAWTRLEPWRHQAAQLFDGPEQRRCLPRLNEISIEYAAGGRHGRGALEALLFIAWLASRLSWRPESSSVGRDGYRFRLSGPGGPLTALAGPRRSAAAGGSLLSVRLEAGRDGDRAAFTVQATKDPAVLAAAVSLPGAGWQRPARIAPQDEPDLLARELTEHGVDPIYERALSLAVDLLSI